MVFRKKEGWRSKGGKKKKIGKYQGSFGQQSLTEASIDFEVVRERRWRMKGNLKREGDLK